MDTELKSKLVDLAVKILKELDYLPQAIQEFRQTGLPYRSEEPDGILFELSEEERKMVESIESGRDGLCYAVIKGAYHNSCGDTYHMTAYLYITKDDLERFEENTGSDTPLNDIFDRFSGEYAHLGYRAWALVDSGYCVESGTVAIKGKNGGLTRTC